MTEVITHCTACCKEHVPEYPDFPDAVEQYAGALEISFSGGDGMFVDPIHEHLRAIICFDCAMAMCCQHPWMRRMLHPHPLEG
jgi:hypothetical protein